MHDIDLVPAEYIQARRLRQRLVLLGAALVFVLIAAASARAWLALRLDQERLGLEQVRQHGRLAGEQRARLATLRAQKAAGDVQLATLHVLLDDAALDALWPAVDEAYNERVWLDTLSYARTVRGDAVATAASAAAPVATAAPTVPPTLQHAVELYGHGLDHAAVTEFKHALGARPGLATLRLADSGLKQLGTLEVVAFHLTATLGPSPRQLQ